MIPVIPGMVFLSIKPGIFYGFIKKQTDLMTMIYKKSGYRNLKINTLSLR